MATQDREFFVGDRGPFDESKPTKQEFRCTGPEPHTATSATLNVGDDCDRKLNDGVTDCAGVWMLA